MKREMFEREDAWKGRCLKKGYEEEGMLIHA